MAYYEMIIPAKQDEYIPAINRLARRAEAAFATATIKEGTLYELNFHTKEQLDEFKEKLRERLSKRIG